MLEKQYYYLDDAAKLLTEKTGHPFTQEDLIDQAIQEKLFLHISASNWQVKYMNNAPFRFNGYCAYAGLNLKSAIQSIKKGENVHLDSLPVTRTEFARYHIPVEDNENFAILIPATETSCPLAITDLVVHNDALQDFVRCYTPPKMTKSITKSLPVEDTASANIFRQNLTDTWELKFNDQVCPPMPHRVGFFYIQQLLKNQNKTIKNIELVSIYRGNNTPTTLENVDTMISAGLTISESSNAGQSIDKAAIEQYKEHLEELQDLIAEAAESGDIDAQEKYEEQFDIIIKELKRNTDHRGRSKIEKSSNKKINQAIARNIKNAISTIQPQNLELFEHLTTSIKTGETCRYEPPTSIAWILY